MAGGHRCNRAACADDLKPLAGLLVFIGGEFGQVFLEKPAHQGKARGVVFDIVELVAQGGHAQRHADPIHHFCSWKGAAHGVKPRMQAHDGAGAFAVGHRAEIDPHQFGRSAADIYHQQLLGSGRNQRRAGNDGQARLFLGLDDFQLQPGIAFDLANKFRSILGAAAGLGCDKAHALYLVAAQFLLADAQRLHRAPHRGTAEAAALFQTGAQLHRFGKAIHHMKLAALGLGNQHAATVGAQIQRGIQLGRVGRIWRGAFDRFWERARTFGTLGRHFSRPPFRVTPKLWPMTAPRKRHARGS